MRRIFTFPNPVNEVSARLVAGGVVVMAVLTIAVNLKWATAVLAYGFVARVLSGPTLSPLGQLVTLSDAPVAHRRTAGGRTAQALRTRNGRGVLGDGSGPHRARPSGAAQIVLAFLVVAALLESALGLCLGCRCSPS